VSDANSRVWVIDVADVTKPEVLNVIETATGDPHRLDELCYDSQDKLRLPSIKRVGQEGAISASPISNAEQQQSIWC
jgi:hypothetical protein